MDEGCLCARFVSAAASSDRFKVLRQYKSFISARHDIAHFYVLVSYCLLMEAAAESAHVNRDRAASQSGCHQSTSLATQCRIDLVSDVSALPPQEVTSSVPTVKLLAHNETIVGARSSQIY